jgi:stage II sporulation protein D
MILKILNHIPPEDYLKSVVGSEAGQWKEPEPEFLKAQAIIARTWAYHNPERHRNDNYDFCDLTHCQVYGGINSETPSGNHAVRATSDQVLTFNGKLLDAYYTSTCGGSTSSASEVWVDKCEEYPEPVRCCGSNIFFCQKSPHFLWNTCLTGDQLGRAFFGPGAIVTALDIINRSSSGRVLRIRVCAGALKRDMSGEDFRIIAGRVLGWNKIKSASFSVTEKGNLFYFSGAGLGHGVGMCQYGAMELARCSRHAEQILSFYYPGSQVKNVRQVTR